LDQLLQGRAVLVVLAGDQDVHVRRLGAFDDQGVLGRVEAGFQGVVGVDQRQVHLVQHARQGGGFQFADADALGVVGDVARGGGDAGLGLEGDDAGLGQQQQGTAAVGGVVGDHHVGAIGQVVQVGDLVGVGAEGLDVDAGHTDQ